MCKPTDLDLPERCPHCGAATERVLGEVQHGVMRAAVQYRCGHVFGSAAESRRRQPVNLELAGLLVAAPVVGVQ